LTAFRENYQRFVDLGATVLGLSVESHRAHAAFAESLQLPFPLLSDLNREVVQAYGVMYTPDNRHREGFYGIAKRSAFVLDRDGVVLYAWSSDDTLVLPDLEEVLAATATAAGAGRPG
jgi:glutaredoxin-dependent peroxiredoxin